MKELAPIGLTVYGRLEHTKKAVEALQKNTLAKESKLYIFSDGPKYGDEEKVKAMREYLKTIDGFKEIEIIERLDNNRIKNNRGGQKYLLEKYDKMIWMAEDIVTASGYLQFMNDGLEIYKDKNEILSITGYGLPIIIHNIEYDSYVLQRFNAWGIGIWKKKYDQVKYISLEEYIEFINDNQQVKEFVKSGADMLNMLELEVRKQIDAFDIRAMYCQFKNNMYTVYPLKSMVQNIGHDGSGVHCGVTDKFNHKELWDKTDNFVFSEDIKLNQHIVKENFDFRFSMNKYTKELIINDLVSKIESLDADSFSIYGIGELTNLLIARLFVIGSNKKITYFIDSDADKKQIFVYEKQAVTPKQAIENGEHSFVILSWNHRELLKNSLLNLVDNISAINVLVPEILKLENI